MKTQQKAEFMITELLPNIIDNDTVFYVANFRNSFVIISAESSAPPILGYSPNNRFDITNAPPALKYLLNCYKKEIRILRKLRANPTKEIRRKWDELSEGIEIKSATPIVSPLLQTTWGQLGGYNDLCPSNCPAGCVAVAMAQVLFYWSCRVEGTGQHSYQSDYGTESANFATANYNWHDMSENNGDSDNALLIYHCGVSVNMDYGQNGSGASIHDVDGALEDYFGFKTSTDVKKRISHPFDWKSILKANLNYGWPILYRGQDDALSTPEQAHMWVIDGYDSDNNFHCNWGWNGEADGYFALSDLNPVVNSQERDYAEWQMAVTYIEPIRTTGIEIPNLSSHTFIYNSNGYNLTIPEVEGASGYEWTTDKGTISGNGRSVTLYTDCSANVRVRAYNAQCDIYSSFDSGLITIEYPISGPSLICSSGASFSISNLPNGASINWNTSSNISRSSSQGSNPCTFTASGSGQGWVQATITTNCGDVILPQKTVYAGTPDPQDIDFVNVGPYYPGSMVLCEDIPNDGIVRWDAAGSILEYAWSVYDDGSNSWQVNQHPMDPFAEIPMENVQIIKPYGSVNGWVNVKVKARNACGWGNYSAPAFQFSTTTCNSYLLSLSPNPSTVETTISLETIATDAKSTEALQEWDLEVYNQGQQLKARKQKINGSQATLNTSGWKEGVYIIRAKVNGEVLTEKLVVKEQ